MINSILLAEDNLEQCFFFRKALKEVAPEAQLNEVNDGDALIELLERYLPDLLFLDLAMPCKNGIQCIQEIREDRAYDNLPIIVFTMSSQNNSIQAAYGLGANLYFVKPENYDLLVASLRRILTMDWSDLKSINQQHFQNNKYIPFTY